MPTRTKKLRGFAALSKEKRRKIAILGGKAQGKHNNPANFANNPKRAALAGRKGGLKVSKNAAHMAAIARRRKAK